METLDFVVTVKDHFSNSNQMERYNQFSHALKDFRSHKISSSAAVSVVKSVFEGHENLLQQFMTFLPPNLQEETATTGQEKKQPQELQQVALMSQELEEVEVSGEEEQPSQLKDGIAFFNKVRSRFGDDVYRSFLKTMCEYGKKKKPAAEVYDDVFDLFHGHAVLIYEFEGFLEDNTEKALKEIQRTKAFAMEDRMHEVDVLRTSMGSAITQAEGILQGIAKSLSPLHLRCFERLYAENFGPQLVEMLKENPEAVLPRVLPRLKTKHEELIRARQLSHQFWAELHRLRKQKRKRQPN